MSDTPIVSVKRFGEVDVTVIRCGEIHWTPGFVDGQDWTPGAAMAEDGRSILGINYAMMRTTEALVLIDPNSFGPNYRLGSVATLHPGPPIEAIFRELDVDPAEITHVLVTHGHSDHFTALLNKTGDAPRFPSAQHYFPAADVPADDDSGYGVEDVRRHLRPVQDAGLLTLVEGDREVCPGVTLMATPGESAGHQVIRLDTPTARFYYLGDLVHYPAEVGHIGWVAASGRDTAALVASRKRVFAEAAAKPSAHVFTHGRFPAWGEIVEVGPERWTWRYL